MPYKHSPKLQIMQLQRTLEDKVKLLKQVQAENARLQYKHAVLKSACQVRSCVSTLQTILGINEYS